MSEIKGTAEPTKTIIAEVQTPTVRIDKNGLLTFNNHDELRRAAVLAIFNNFAPKHLIKTDKFGNILKDKEDRIHEDSVRAVCSALLLCKQFNLPQKAMNQMGDVKGKLTCFGSLVTAIAERHKDYGEKEEFFITEKCERISVANANIKENVWAAVVRIKKKNGTIWNEYVFSRADATKARLDNPTKKGPNGSRIPNPDSTWIKYQRDMLMHKARKRALNSEYASALEGIEYHEDIIELERDVTPPTDTAEELKKAL